LLNNPFGPLADLGNDIDDPGVAQYTKPIPIPPAPYNIFLPTHNATIELPNVDSFYGDTLSESKPETSTRFLTKNIHHVSTNATDDELRIHFGDQHRLSIDYFGITEHKLDTHQYTVRQSFNDSAHQAFTQHKIEIGSSELQTVSTYKPGGTAIIAQGDATG
jgi:hypothetical protein